MAGGKSTRMGVNKGLCIVHNDNFIDVIINSLKNISEKIILVSSVEEYDIFSIKRIEDVMPDKGPVGGIYTALNKSETEDNIIISCDVPLITSKVLNLLVNDSSNADVVQLADQNRNMPLIAKYKKRLTPFFRKKIDNNELKLNRILKELNVKTIRVSAEQEKQLQNINTPEELKQIQSESKS